MKLYVIPSKKKNWTNQATREALNVEVGQQVRISNGDKSVEVEIRRAPSAASKVMRGVTAASGAYGIGIEPYYLNKLGIKEGSIVEVENSQVSMVQRTSTSQSAAPAAGLVTNGPGNLHKLSLRERIETMKIGGTLEISESAIRSSVYSAAKEAGMSVKKVGPTTIQRVS